jgi:hypothetical protein
MTSASQTDDLIIADIKHQIEQLDLADDDKREAAAESIITTVETLIYRARSAERPLEVGSEPGWKLVPTKHNGQAGMTCEMADALWSAFERHQEHHGFYESMNVGYSAMLDVAPAPPTRSAEAEEDPYQELHLYEGDSALVIRENGNKTLYGVQRPELLALFEVRSAEALPDEVAELIKWLGDAANYFEARPTLGEDRAHWANVQNAENCRKIATALSRLSAELAEVKAKVQGLHRDAEFNGTACDEQRKRAERAEELADKYKWQVRDTCTRAETAERLVASQAEEIRRKDEALAEIAQQSLGAEIPFDEWTDADFEGGYDACVQRARAALLPEGKPQEVGR